MVWPHRATSTAIACCGIAMLVASACSSTARHATTATSTTTNPSAPTTIRTPISIFAGSAPVPGSTVTKPTPTAFVTALPVVRCPTTSALTSSAPPSTIVPPTGLQASAASQLAIYTDPTGKVAVLAPRGWNCRAEFGADGSGGIGVSPKTAGVTKEPAVEIAAGTDGGCDGCTRSTVCGYFPDIAEPGVQCRARGAHESVTRLRTHLVGLFDPPGVFGPNPANGVMIVQVVSGQPADWYERCTLPPSDHALCTAILNDFVRFHPPS